MSDQESTPAEGSTPEATPEPKPEGKTFDELTSKNSAPRLPSGGPRPSSPLRRLRS